MPPQPPIDDLTAARVELLEVDGLRFRDLDHDGELAPYEDWRRSVPERVADLLGRMTLEEKVGAMLHGTIAAAAGPLAMLGRGEAYDHQAAAEQINRRFVTSMITRLEVEPVTFALQNNLLQDTAAAGRLGIPVTVSSDPRHHFGELFGATVSSDGFTEWPETLGLAALGDPELVRQFGECVRREYRAVGIQMSLAPQADLATNARWPRFAGTFGENPELVNRLVGAYVEGAQGTPSREGGRDGLNAESVACIVKHWVGYGATSNGFDGHNYYGRHAAFPAGAFDDHVAAFADAFAVGVAGVMPTYSILRDLELDGEPLEQVGAGFNAQLLQGLLRDRHGFGGLVLSDWAITRDATEPCRTGTPPQGPGDIAMCWGVEDLTRVERFAACVNAGVDQIGGEEDPAPLLEAVRSGLVAEARVDAAVARVLTQKFELGLFESPFVDPVAAAELVGSPAMAEVAFEAQSSSLVVLAGDAGSLLPSGATVFAEGKLADELVRRGVTVTDRLGDAQVAVAVTTTPHQDLHPTFFFGNFQHEGDLDFKPDDPEWQRLDALLDATPTVVVVTMDRPAILTPFVGRAAAIIADLGASPAALAEALVGSVTPRGTMPFRLFASMDDAIASPCDRPGGAEPLFAFGAGG